MILIMKYLILATTLLVGAIAELTAFDALFDEKKGIIIDAETG